MKIAVVIPSRGLIHSRTIESVQESISFARSRRFPNLQEMFFYSHDKPIPEAQNYLFERAFGWGADYVWSVEEDNLVYKDTLLKMIQFFITLPRTSTMGVLYVDYPIGDKLTSGVCRKNYEILWGPLGCTLVTRVALEKLPKPWFSTEKTWRITSKDPLELVEEDIPNKYGGHDIYFGMQCKKHDVGKFAFKDYNIGHIKPKKLAEGQSNNGAHEFDILEKIEIFQDYK